MDTVLIAIVLVLVALLLIAAVAGLVIQLTRPQAGAGEVAATLRGVAQAVQQEQTQLAALAEKVTHLEPLTQTVGSVQVELRGLTEKIATVEQNQGAANQGLGHLATGLNQTGQALTNRFAEVQRESGSALTELKTLTAGLSEATAAMRAELARAKSDLTELQTQAKARQDQEQQTATSIKRLEAIIAGTQSKGSAGENILELVFARLPVEWQVRNFRVGGKPVEFGLRLPNNLILPIDSKWAATHLLEQFLAASDPAERERLKGAIEDAVREKAKEVKKYIDPSLTAPFGVAVIPDAIHDLCTGLHAEAFQLNVVLVSYSMFIPYLLLVFQTTLKTSQSLDRHKLEAYVETAQAAITAVQGELDGRFSRALTMLTNSRDDMRAHLSKAGGSLTGLQVVSAEAEPAGDAATALLDNPAPASAVQAG